MDKNTVHIVTFSLMMIGAINWGLVGLFGLNLVEMLFSAWPALIKLVYITIGISAVYVFATHKDICTICREAMKKK